MALKIISRANAKAQGLTRYYVGQFCLRGHLAERHVSNLTCMECQREKARLAYQARDKEAERERLRRWRAANREKDNAAKRERGRSPEGKAYKAAWYAANRERVRAKARSEPGKYRASNIASAKRWTDANPEKASEYSRIHARQRRAQKHKSSGTHTAADLADILRMQKNRCAHPGCGADLRKVGKHLDHIVPLSRGGSNDRRNLQFLCPPHNLSKGAKHPITYARSLGLLI